MRFFKVINLLLISMGINLIVFTKRIRFLPYLFWDYLIFSNKLKIKTVFDPVFEINESSANLGEYFFQDLYVARKIIQNNPDFHYDVGSRVDGFISILSTHLKVKVLDIRPLQLSIENIDFQQLDIVNLPSNFYGISKSLSCLHTLEHIGLGRYGDPIGEYDWINALINLRNLLSNNGILYISIPIGKEMIRFNSNRIFSPFIFYQKALDIGLDLMSFAYLSFDNNEPKEIHESKDPIDDFKKIDSISYALGIFIFKRIA